MFDLFDALSDGTGFLVSVASSLSSLAVIAAYVFGGLALTSLCRASGSGRVWMAWVPFANLYLLGLMADVYTDTYFPTGVPGDPVDASPSTLRRKMLGFSIVSNASGAVAGVSLLVFLFSGIMAFFLALGGFLSGDSSGSDTIGQFSDVFTVAFPIFLAAAVVWVVFYILYLVTSCRVHYRVFALLGTPLPALWTFLGVFVPALPMILYFAYTRKSDRLRERFYPSAEEPDGTAAGDGDVPPSDDPPADPPAPELYQL